MCNLKVLSVHCEIQMQKQFLQHCLHQIQVICFSLTLQIVHQLSVCTQSAK